MKASRWAGPVPFDLDGNLLSHPKHARFDWDRREYNLTWCKSPRPFHAAMRLEDTVHSGRSAKHLSLIDERTGKHYTLFVRDLLTIAITLGIRDGGRIEGLWRYVKRGQNYGITLETPL